MQKLIAVGDKVNMEILIRGQRVEDEQRRRILTCRIMDLPGPNLLRISMPIYEGRMVPLAIGDQYQLTVFAEKGIYGSAFTVVERLREGNLFLADMELQGKLQKVQRREFFRHDCRLPAEYHLITEEESLLLGQEEIAWKRGVILDISGGGLRMAVSEQEEPGQLAQIRFQISAEGEQREVCQYGQVIAVLPNAVNPQLFELRIAFEKIGDREREQIIRFIFDEERKRLSREKGLN